MKQKRIIAIIILLISIFSLTFIANAEETVTLYAADGRSQSFLASEVEAQLNVGWYEEPVQMLYSVDCRTTKVFKKSEVPAQLTVGWYEYPIRKVYAPDGRVEIIPLIETSEWLNVGWFINKKMYAPDGRSELVAFPDIEAWKKVGWYEEPVQKLYAPDGREEVFKKTEVSAQLKVGWYEKPVQLLYAPNKSQVFKKSEVATQLTVGWHEEPVMEIIAPGGKVMIIPKTQLSAYKNVGWFDLEAEKNKYGMNTKNGIKSFLERFFPVVYTSVGAYKMDWRVSDILNIMDISAWYPSGMPYNFQYNTDYSIADRVSAKKQIKRFMYNAANAVMSGNNIPIEMDYVQGGYEYPSIKVGWSSVRFCSSRNYKTNYTNGMPEDYIVGFYWTPGLDDYDFKEITDF